MVSRGKQCHCPLLELGDPTGNPQSSVHKTGGGTSDSRSGRCEWAVRATTSIEPQPATLPGGCPAVVLSQSIGRSVHPRGPICDLSPFRTDKCLGLMSPRVQLLPEPVTVHRSRLADCRDHSHLIKARTFPPGPVTEATLTQQASQSPAESLQDRRAQLSPCPGASTGSVLPHCSPRPPTMPRCRRGVRLVWRKGTDSAQGPDTARDGWRVGPGWRSIALGGTSPRHTPYSHPARFPGGASGQFA